jgi:predicted RNase H-like HicB family nuclease
VSKEEPMSRHSTSFDLSIVFEPVEQGNVQATVPAVPGTISVGRTRAEARENVLDALSEMLAVSPEKTAERVDVERLRARLQITDRYLGREL